jgi:alkaline phosphatase D
MGLTSGISVHSGPVPLGELFTLGVASGDPAPDGFVLWTRLAPVPLAEDGLGGMPSRPVPVDWEVALDPACSRVVRRGTAYAVRQWAHSVHVVVTGLKPGREYWYRFKAGSSLSPTGRALTAPAPCSAGRSLDLAVTSCANFQHGYFTAYARVAQEWPDLVLHLGDYIYEYGDDHHSLPGGNVRDHEGPQATTLADYRRRYALYKTDPDLQSAHAAAPWCSIMDDHEVVNNWNSLTAGARRRAAFRAYYEHMPLRRNARPAHPAMRLYRRLQWGRLATFHLLDTRQYRDPQLCGSGFAACSVPADPERTIMGVDQERWLLDGFRRSEAIWDIIGQQVFFGQRDRDPGPESVVRQDAWDGYTACRTRVSRSWLKAGVRNTIVLTGDVHAHWAGNLALDYDDPHSPLIGAEFAVTSITSGGDGADVAPRGKALVEENPHLLFHLRRRGYLMLRIEPATLVATAKILPYVRVPGAPVLTAASFSAASGIPGLRHHS